MSDKATTACFTGHRKLREPTADITGRLQQIIEHLIQSGYKTFCAGGARGFDTLAAEAVISLQAQYPQIELVLMIPFADQYRYEKGWSKAEIEQYHRLQQQAAHVYNLAPAYRPGIYYKRNQNLVDASSVCIAYMTKGNSGTGYTVKYAQEQGIRIINLADDMKERK